MEGLHLCGHGRNDKKRGESKPFVDGVLVTWECMGLGYRGEEELKNMARLRVWVGGRLGPWKSGEACLGGGAGCVWGCYLDVLTLRWAGHAGGAVRDAVTVGVSRKQI